MTILLSLLAAILFAQTVALVIVLRAILNPDFAEPLRALLEMVRSVRRGKPDLR